uniref:Selenocysteine lyase n=1 Tax=Panagrolaimus superbus TaxID=310955 RepID=A0A914YPL1_9BILA
MVSKCFQVPIHGVIYMSGGTEVNNTIINVAVDNWWDKFNTIPYVITSKMEHPSILKLLEHLQKKHKLLIHWMDICPKVGIVEHQKISDKTLMQTCLITIMAANNETGVIQPVNEIFGDLKSKISKLHPTKYLPFFHSDASQALGRINISEIFDMITVTGHKFGGPCIAALITKNEEFLKILQQNPFIFGGGQEGGYRSGTENLPMIAGLSVAIKWATENILDFKKVSQIRDYFEIELIKKFGAKSFYQNSVRLPNTSSICFPTYPGLAAEILEKCDKIFAASTGAACHSDGITLVFFNFLTLYNAGQKFTETLKFIRDFGCF